MASTTVVDPSSSSSTVPSATPLVSMEAKMIVATGHSSCQLQLKDMLSKEDTSSMVVVVASSNQTSTPKPRSAPVVMDPGLLAVACSGSWRKLQSFLKGVPPSPPPVIDPTSSDGTIQSCWLVESFLVGWRRGAARRARRRGIAGNGTNGSSAIQQPPCDQEANLRVSFLDGITVQGDTFLHVMATNSDGVALIEDGLGHVRRKAVQFLSRQNKCGDTPLHCAARAAKSQMVSFLVDLARGNNDANSVKALLEKQNNRRWTVLHEAVRAGNNDIISLLKTEDPELASIPQDGTSPLYLAILMGNKTIARTLHEKSSGVLSYSGPNGQNALHAAVLRRTGLIEMLLGWNKALTIEQDENGSTPLHFAASMENKNYGRNVCSRLLKANPDALYQPDHEGSFPTHVAASFGATRHITDFLNKSPNCAGLRDAKGRTFLHVAVEKKERGTVNHACRNRSLSSWILNMQDNNGNTALHLATQAGGLRMFCALLGNRRVQLNLTNEKGETPRDIVEYNCRKRGMQNLQNSEQNIRLALRDCGARIGFCRQDYLKEKDTVQATQYEIHKMEIMKDMTQNLCIGSVLIATVTFGATFTVPGGYRADDHPNGGTPTLSGRYTFDAFTLANALSFTLSAMAIISLMFSGSPFSDHASRMTHLRAASYLIFISVKSLVAAFAIGTYMLLAPISHKTAVAVCVLSSLVPFYQHFEVIIKQLLLVVPYYVRKGLVFTCGRYFIGIVSLILIENWPIIIIFCSTVRNYPAGKVEPPVQPPTQSP